ncbi:unnamed protein product [Adineta steineri]|uniref:valine--tRNA ligase n=3 Tax=Adineta steineri TaxID=433720 RepID=A0A818JKH5_9BILA|nr:unnamed protein product [Adineta steineri]
MMTYIERHGWCSSLISSTICPSNIDKSTKPCPIRSLSFASTSLISNSDSISLNTNSILSPSSLTYNKRNNNKASTSNVRSSSGRADDYYTTKRIEELHERMDDIQITSFLQFINHHLSLKKENHKTININDIAKDLSNGHVLIDLIEILSSTKLKRERGHTRFHSLTNIQYVLDYLKLRMQHINISPHEIVSGNRKQILALLWIIMKTFDFPGFRITNKNCFVENTLLGFGQDRSIIIKWLNNIINQSLNTIQIYIKDFYLQTWINGYYLSIIIKYLIPLSIKYLTRQCFDDLKELNNLNSDGKQCFKLCLSLSNYCFNTITIIDEADKSERCLFKYFTELQKNIISILKSNHIGKLVQNNPYTKQILDTVIQTTTTTTEHSSHIINNNEQYLICIKDDNQHVSSINSSISLSNDNNKLSNLKIVEKSQSINNNKLERENRWEKPENLQSNFHAINNDSKISNKEQVEMVINGQQEVNDTIEKSEELVLLPIEIEQDTKLDSIISETQDLNQFTPTIVEYQPEEKIEQPIINVQEQQILSINDNTEEISSTLEDLSESTISYEKLDDLQELMISNQENKQFSDDYETLPKEIEQSFQNETCLTTTQQSIDTVEEQKQSLISNENIEQSDVKDEVPEQNTTTILPENINEELEQCITSIKPSLSMNEESLQPIESKPETIITSVKINENLEQPKTEESSEMISLPENNTSILTKNNKKSSQSTVSNKKKKRNKVKTIDNEKLFQQPIVESERIEENESSSIINNKLEPLIVVESNKEIQPIVENNFIATNGKLPQSITEDLPQSVISNGTTKTFVENNSPIVANKNLEKSTIITSSQPITSNDEVNKSTPINKKTAATSTTTKKVAQTASSNKENQHFITSNKPLVQPTIVVKEPEQRKSITEQTVSTTSKGNTCSDIINIQSVKVNHESSQGANSLKKPEHSTVSIEKPKQTVIIPEVTEQISCTNTNKKSEQTEVSLEKQDQPITLIEEPRASTISNNETKKSSSKNKKSRRSNTKKGKSAQVMPINNTEPILQDEEETIESVLPSVNLTTVVQEQIPTNIVTGVDTSPIIIPEISLNGKLSNNSENLQNSSALRSRKTKKKKTIATTTTTVIEKPSFPPMLTSTTITNRNLFVTIQEFLHDRRIIASKYVFILIFRMLIKVLLFNHSLQRITAYRWLSKTHKPSLFEPKWASVFAQATTNSYLPSLPIKNEKPFVMLFPPPNVTGTLHLGHALTTCIHDSLLRWHTMQRKSYARCIPGYDHAGIATQVIVEKHIAPQTREQMGREKFLEECYQWSSTYRQTIETQLKRLCPLFDWTNTYFTMDKNLIEYVRDSFLSLYNDGLIYRDRRIVNWCCQLRSVVSDIEVDSKEINGRQKISIPGYSKEIELGVLYNIAYKVIDEQQQQDEEIIVSTTRPETILADTGIAVHPLDSRYMSLKNKFVQNPFNPQDRLPIIFDESVDQNFGTGAVKLTPGHDAFDYTLAMKHNLPVRTMLNDQGRVQLHLDHPFYQQLNDLHRYDARDKVLQLLENQGLRRGEQEQQKMIIPICSRTGDIIEPMVKEQWFLDTTEMSRQASSIVDNDTLKLTPSSTRKVWKYWLNNNRPWCLSRQLWWGHSIPMYRCSIKNKLNEYQWIGAKSLEEATIKAAQLYPDILPEAIHIEQDQDVLDTWFSSGLLPISIFYNTNKQEFPTTLLDTGYDIMFFWVARMVMLSLKLTNQIPFHEVLFHGLICDPNGKKMSKSLGNIIDPMDVVNGISLQSLQTRLEQSHLSRNEIERSKRIQANQYPSGIEPIGSDGLRLCLLSHDIYQQSIRFDPTQFDYVGRYCNKFWNAYKYVTEFALIDMNFRDEKFSNITYEQIEKLSENRLVDCWMLNELNKTIGKVNDCLNNYTFHLAIVRLRDSFLKDFCDFYIEFSKIPIKQQSNEDIKSNVQILLYYLLKQYLILYHPFLPAMTEELWQDLTQGKQGYLIHQLYPTMKHTDNINPMDSQVIQIIRLILKNSTYFKQMLRLSRDSDIIIYFNDQNHEDLSTHIENYLTEIRTITRLNNIHVVCSSSNNSLNKSKYSFNDYITDNVELIFNLNDDKQTKELVEKHEERLSKQVDKLQDDLGVNDTATKFYQENNDEENIEREKNRREIIMEDMKLTQRRHERFVELAQKRTVIEKKNKKEKRS